MSPSLESSRPREGITIPGQQRLDLSGLRPPTTENGPSTASEREKQVQPKVSDPNPEHFAPENPTNRELAKERWYTRAAWASVTLGYCGALFAIKYGEPTYSTRASVTGLLIDTLYSYWALRNSELRKFILDGSVLPTPSHSDKTVRNLLGVGAAFQFLACVSNTAQVAELLMQAEYNTAAVRGVISLTTLHLGFAWARRVRFFGSMDLQ